MVEVQSSGPDDVAVQRMGRCRTPLTEPDFRDARQRFAFLADAAGLLAGSLEYEITLQRVADLAVPALADWCLVDIVANDGAIHHVAMSHVDPAKLPLLQRLRLEFPPTPDAPHAYPRVLATGMPDLIEHLSEEDGLQRDASPEFQELMRALGPRSYMCVPLIARGQVIGAMTFFMAESGRTFTRDDLQFAGELAWRAALAVDNAHSFLEAQRARELAEAAGRRSAFLGEASALLASSLDYEKTLERVANLAVPHLADWCAVFMLEPDSAIRTVAVAHSDPERVQLARELMQHLPYRGDVDRPYGVPAVVRTGRSEVIPALQPEHLDRVSAAGIDGIFHALGFRSVLTVPMTARGHTLGAMQFVNAESGRTFSVEDVPLAEDLACRAALSVDNARLYRDAQRVAAERAAMLSHMAECVLVVDAAGTLTYMNAAARELVESDHELTGAYHSSYLRTYEVSRLDGSPYPADELPVARALRGETVRNAVWCMRTLRGRRVIVEGSAAPFYAPDGAFLGAVLAYRDVTEQFELERQKDEFLSAAAHDLKTPLTSIKGLSQMLQRRARRGAVAPDQLVDTLQRIDGTVTRMTALINEMLDLARIQMERPFDLDLDTVDLAHLAREVSADFQHASARHRLVTVAPAPVVGLWDAARLERVLANLVNNAIKYSPEGGDITITVGTDPDSAVAVLSVQDRGIGIPEHDLTRIFERFQRAGNVTHGMAGTGMG